MGEMLIRGELDGSLALPGRQHPGRPQHGRCLWGDAYLFPDPAAEGRRFYAKTGLFPINHTVVVRRSLLESRPWIALNLYSAFVAAKEEIARAGRSYLHWYFESGLLDGGVKRTLAEHDPLAYGFKAARPVLEAVAEYVYEQAERAPRGAQGNLRAQHARRVMGNLGESALRNGTSQCIPLLLALRNARLKLTSPAV